MKYLKTLALSLLLASSGAWAQCDMPDAPSIPEGATASYDDMINAQQAVKTFQKANQEYRSCVEENIASTQAVASNEDASDRDKAAATMEHGEAVERYNAAVTREEDIAGKFNSQIQAYQAANAE